MQAHGWVGRPILLLPRRGNKYQALTGSHRYAAAKKAGLKKIPCVILSRDAANAVQSAWRSPSTENYGILRSVYKIGPCFIPFVLAKILMDWPEIFEILKQEPGFEKATEFGVELWKQKK